MNKRSHGLVAVGAINCKWLTVDNARHVEGRTIVNLPGYYMRVPDIELGGQGKFSMAPTLKPATF